ncbi:hypothetical protein NQ794_18495, partial [Acinetobacter baumannii]|nr:hypothetical protein [Acinetobacter baumannii]
TAKYTTVESILSIPEQSCSNHRKQCLLFWNLYKNYLSLEDVENYLKTIGIDNFKDDHNIKKLICLYDYKKYGEILVK